MNAITTTGNVVADPEAIAYGDGQELARLRIGNNEYVNGESVSNGFFDVTVFGIMAKNVLASIHKGDRVVVTGRLQQSSFENGDGLVSYHTRIMASAIGASLEFQTVVGTPNPRADKS